MPTSYTKQSKPTTSFTKENKPSPTQGFDYVSFDTAVFDAKAQTTYTKETKP